MRSTTEVPDDSPQCPPRSLPNTYIGNHSDAPAFSEHRLHGEFSYSTYSTDMLVQNSRVVVSACLFTGCGGHGYSLSAVLTGSQLNSAHGPNTHVQYGGILQRLTEPRSRSAHQCHSCMTLHQTARTSPVKQHTSWRRIPHFLTMPLHSHFLPSINSVLWKLDIHTFFEAVNFMESVHPRWVRSKGFRP